MKKILQTLTKRNYAAIFMCMVIIVLQVWLQLKSPEYSQRLTQEISTGHTTLPVVRKYAWMVFYISCCNVALNVLYSLICGRLSSVFGRNLRSKLYHSICNLDNEQANRIGVGSLITRTGDDISMVMVTLMMVVQIFVQSPLICVWALLKIQNTNPGWTGAMAVCTVAMCAAIIILVAIAYPKVKKIRKLTDQYNDVTCQTMDGVRVLRAFRADRFQQTRVENVNQELSRTSFASERVMNLLKPVISTCSNALTLVIYWIGAYAMMNAASPERAVIMGNMTAFSQYSVQIIGAFTSMVAIFAAMPEIRISWKRLQEIFDAIPQIAFPENGTDVIPTPGSVHMKHVNYTYAGANAPCLQDISFTIQPGEKIAITGPTGCGKSTLLYLMMRLMDADSGEIDLGGSHIRDFSAEQICNMLSVAPQRAALFNGTVRFNVCYGSNEDETRLENALRIAAVDFLDDKGNDMEISQSGTNLSGGQKQRLCLARALYRQADIYLLDDTFSALDNQTDADVRYAIAKEYADATIITVSQRISTILGADRIFVMEDGRIVGMGTHSELMCSCTVYQELVHSQLGEEA